MSRPKKQKEDTRIEVTFKIDQTILADFQMMCDDYKEMCGDPRNCPDPHTMDMMVEQMMVANLRGHMILKALNKYS